MTITTNTAHTLTHIHTTRYLQESNTFFFTQHIILYIIYIEHMRQHKKNLILQIKGNRKKNTERHLITNIYENVI